MPNPDPAALVPLTPITYHILLAAANGPVHGYGMKKEIEERTAGLVRLGAGTLYEGIHRMEKKGLLKEVAPPRAVAEEASSRWRFYTITPFGRKVLTLEVRRLEADVRVGRAALSGKRA